MDGAPSTDTTQAVTVATPTPDKMTETVSLVQYGTSTTTGVRATGSVPPGRRRRASMQDALDHTKINTSLYDPTLVRYNTHISLTDYVCNFIRLQVVENNKNNNKHNQVPTKDKHRCQDVR